MTTSSIEAMNLKRAILDLVLDLHPENLTIDELILKLGKEDGSGTIRWPITELEGSGLLRRIEDTIVPTHAAVMACKVFDWLSTGDKESGGGP